MVINPFNFLTLDTVNVYLGDIFKGVLEDCESGIF